MEVYMAELAPMLLSSIICDRVIFDRITGMPSLINIIQNVNSPKFPVRHDSLIFFCELTDGHGTTDTSVSLVDVQNNEKIMFQQHGKVEFKDVKQVVSLAVNLQGVVFEKPGEYRFQIFANQQLLGERRIVCRQVQMPPQSRPQ
jgi:hypothetical protein